MEPRHLNLLFPQWQGGGRDLSTYHGAKEFRGLYLRQAAVREIAVETDLDAAIERQIFAYRPIRRQLQAAHDLLAREIPDTVCTIGGGCDATVPAVSYLNLRYGGDMTLLWFDAHGDLNTPGSSLSQLFYGMPLRTLLGEGDDAIVGALPSTLLPQQAMLLGARDLDSEERAYLRARSVPAVSVAELEQNPDAVPELVRQSKSRNLYIHIDLDVLDPAQFPHVPLPAAGGLRMETLRALLRTLGAAFHIVGLGLMEYQPTGGKRFGLLEDIGSLW